MQVVACAALFLGAKMEETGRKFPEFLKAALTVRYAGQISQLEWALVTTPFMSEADPWHSLILHLPP